MNDNKYKEEIQALKEKYEKETERITKEFGNKWNSQELSERKIKTFERDSDVQMTRIVEITSVIADLEELLKENGK